MDDVVGAYNNFKVNRKYNQTYKRARKQGSLWETLPGAKLLSSLLFRNL
jgi:hypothetical protein